MEPVFEGGMPNNFQATCAQRVLEVLLKHGIEPTPFVFERGATTAFRASFVFQGEEYLIGVFEHGVSMFQGNSLFEIYMDEEFRSEESKIEGFAARLDRYLGGGPWEGPDEKGLPDRIKEVLGRIFRR